MTPKERRRAARDRRGPVEAKCLTCSWSGAATTWRPAKRALAAHTAHLHKTVASKGEPR